MISDVENAKAILKSDGYTCVLYRQGDEYRSRLRGIKPLLELLESDGVYKGFSAADKTVGAGAAYLYVLLGVKCVWAEVISEDAKKILEDNGIEISFEKLVSRILDRSGSGICPIERAAKGSASPEEAFIKIKAALIKLNQKNGAEN